MKRKILLSLIFSAISISSAFSSEATSETEKLKIVTVRQAYKIAAQLVTKHNEEKAFTALHTLPQPQKLSPISDVAARQLIDWVCLNKNGLLDLDAARNMLIVQEEIYEKEYCRVVDGEIVFKSEILNL